MKINFKGPGSKEYYDELLFIQTYYKGIIKRPKVRVLGLSKHFKRCILLYGGYDLLLLLMLIFNWFSSDDSLFTIMLVCFFFILLFVLIICRNLFYVNRTINDYLSTKTDSSFSINEDGIRLSKTGVQTIDLSWDTIKGVYINKHTITFLPTSISYIMICIPIEYKDKIIKSIKNYNHSDLIINNSSRY